MCVMACPFGAVTPSAAFHVAMKCDACMHMDEPACVAGCPTGALKYGDEAEYNKVLAKKRGTIALWVEEANESQKTSVSLDCLAQEDTKA